MGVQKRENKPLNTHNETNPKMEKAENPCSARIIGKRIRSIVSIPMVSKLSTLFGAGDRGRTCMLLAQEPKSCVSANSTTPAYEDKNNGEKIR